MSYPSKIVVRSHGEIVFEASEGKEGMADSACREFTCFASPIIGAAYHHLDFLAGAGRIASRGYQSTFTIDGAETTISPSPSRLAFLTGNTEHA